MNKPTAIPLILDDIRDAKDCFLHGEREKLVDKSKTPAGSWQVVRSFDEFVFWIKKHGIPVKVSFDNDLCQKHYELFVEASKTGAELEWRDIQPRMGIYALFWFLNYCKIKNTELPEIYFHTANPIARFEMEKLLKNHGF